MSHLKLQVILFSVIYASNFIYAHEELLDLTCFNDWQCRQYKNNDVANITCSEGKCHCISSTGEEMKCKPLDQKLSNIIAGPCPCRIPYAECNVKEDTCYCSKEYTASLDKRRCIPLKANLGENCEMDSQCQNVDVFMECDQVQKTCQCRQYFENESTMNGKCQAMYLELSKCTENSDCLKYGPHSECVETPRRKRCKCDRYSVLTENRTACIEIAQLGESCQMDDQCFVSLGPGGVCRDGVCNCSQGFFPMKQIEKFTGSVFRTCQPTVEFGNYCRNEKDCYQYHLAETEQSLTCSFGECNCREGFQHSLADSKCLNKNSGARNQNVHHMWTTEITTLLAVALMNCIFR